MCILTGGNTVLQTRRNRKRQKSISNDKNDEKNIYKGQNEYFIFRYERTYIYIIDTAPRVI